MDDVFVISRGRKLKSIHETINRFHPSIQFTVELEINEQLPFLDVMTYNKKDGEIGYFIYRKPTQTNKYLNYASYHPMAHKIGVCDTLLTRGIKLCDKDHVEDEIEFVKKTLMSNGYPLKMLEKRLDIVKTKVNRPKEDKELQKRVILPYAGPTTTKIAQFLRKITDWEIGYFPGRKITTLVCNMKQKIKKPRKGVYRFSCRDCPFGYIGETGRDYEVRYIEHRKDTEKMNVKSPVALHMAENEHILDDNSLKMLLPEGRSYHRKFKESLMIRSSPQLMNSSKGMNINSIWSSTLIDFLYYGPIT